MTPEELASLNDLPPPPHPSLRAVTGAEAERFAVILARAFEATVACNPHRACFTTIRKHLIDHREDPEDEATVAACEASGALWECLWWSSSCGHFDFIAPTWPALVRKVIAADADLVAVSLASAHSPPSYVIGPAETARIAQLDNRFGKCHIIAHRPD